MYAWGCGMWQYKIKSAIPWELYQTKLDFSLLHIEKFFEGNINFYISTFSIFINNIFISIHAIITVGNVFLIVIQTYKILVDYT